MVTPGNVAIFCCCVDYLVAILKMAAIFDFQLTKIISRINQ